MNQTPSYCCRSCNNYLDRWEWELLYGEKAPAAPVSNVEEVFRKYAAEIDKMYDKRTRGSFSSLGILAAFATELKEAKSK